MTDNELVETLNKAAEQNQDNIPLSFLLRLAAERIEALPQSSSE